MFTALTLSLALGAPVPAPTAPVPAGVAPRLMELKPDDNGKILVTITRTEMQKVQVGVGAAINPGNPGGAPPAVVTKEIPVQRQMTVELGEVKDLVVTTADGKKLDKDEAIKKLAGGAVVIVSGDGKPVSPAFLKVIKDDTLVLTSPELAGPQPIAFPGRPGGGFRPLPPNGVLPVQPLPLQPGGIQILPAQPGGVIQIQVAPAALPAQPLPVPVPEK